MNRPANDTNHLGDRGREALRESGLRITPQRAAILALFEGDHGHWSPQGIWAALEGSAPGLALATVYNTLETFESLGLLRRFTSPDGQMLFDRNLSPHQHALCTTCGAIIDIELPEHALSMLLDTASSMLQFEARAANVWLRGVCAVCR